MSAVPPSDDAASPLRPEASPATPPPPAPQVVVQQQTSAFGRYGRFMVLALFLAVATIVGQAVAYRNYFNPPGGPQERYHSLKTEATEKVAIVTVKGTILGGESFVKKQIDRIREDDQVVAVVLRVDSPGGTVTGSDYLYHHLGKLAEDRDLPIVVSMGSICASGGYYIAMAADQHEDVIFAEPTTWTGSIGVVIPHYDLSGLLSYFNVKDDSIASHQFKLMGSPTRELSSEERAEERELLQELVDISFDRFKDIVVKGRPKLADDQETLETVTTGRIFTSQQALDHGLVDKIGFIEDAIQRAAELANRDPNQLRCVKYTQSPAPLSMLLGAEGPKMPTGDAVDVSALLDLTAPRAYYLCTWLPAILSNR